MRAHPSWRRAGGIAAIAFAAVASIATTKRVSFEPPPFPGADGGATQDGTASDQSAPFNLVLTPTTSTADVSGTVTLSSDLTAALASFRNEHGLVLLDLTGMDLPASESVNVAILLEEPIVGDTDGGLADDAGARIRENVGSVLVVADGMTKHATLGLDPGWSTFCVAGIPCAARFHVQLGSALTAGEIYVSGNITFSVDATFGGFHAPTGFNFPGVEVVLDSQGQDGLDGG